MAIDTEFIVQHLASLKDCVIDASKEIMDVFTLLQEGPQNSIIN